MSLCRDHKGVRPAGILARSPKSKTKYTSAQHWLGHRAEGLLRLPSSPTFGAPFAGDSRHLLEELPGSEKDAAVPPGLTRRRA